MCNGGSCFYKTIWLKWAILKAILGSFFSKAVVQNENFDITFQVNSILILSEFAQSL